MKLEKKFYATKTPGLSGNYMRESAQQAIDHAIPLVRKDRQTYYIVQVIGVVSLNDPPVRVEEVE